MRGVRAVIVSPIISRSGGLVLLVAAMLSLGACEAIRHDRGSDSCLCYSDVTGGSSATIGHKWKL